MNRSLGPTQHGQTMLLTVLLLLLALITVGLYYFVTPAKEQIEDDKQTETALIQARDALTGYAAANSSRPGALPCPDQTNDGVADTCTTAATRIGLLPWKTLQIDSLKDGSGSPLLYAVSNAYRATTSAINSDTAGDYTVTGTTPASNVIAVVFAPGGAVGNQQRDAITALCSTTGTTIARNRCVANYLEGGNESGGTSFVTALSSSSFNDRLLLITPDNLFPAVVTRVALEMRTSLNSYYTTNGYFPNAAAFSDTTYTCSPAVTQGRLPLNIVTGCTQSDWVLGAFPPWFITSNWHQYIFYAVSSDCTSAATAAACIASGGLTVSGVSTNARALLIISGRAYTGQARPCATLNDCLEDAENINGDSVFQQPVLSATNNDRLIIVSP